VGRVLAIEMFHERDHLARPELRIHHGDELAAGSHVLPALVPRERITQWVALQVVERVDVVSRYLLRRLRDPKSSGIARRGGKNLHRKRVHRAAGVVGRVAQCLAQLRRHAQEDDSRSLIASHRLKLRRR